MGEKKINLLVAMLKIIACYAVVSIHFGETLPCAGLAVPIFMFLSFYFTSLNGGGGLPRRIKRLGLPFLFWGIVPFLVHCVFARRIDWMSLFSQLTAGAPENHPLYFLMLMMLYSILVFPVAKLPSRIENVSLVVLALLCFVLQYSGLNARIWNALPRWHELLCGRFFELLPAALFGRFVRNCRNRFNDRTWVLCGIITILVFGVALWFHLDISPLGYDYQGVPNLLATVGICILCIVIGEHLKFHERIVGLVMSLSGATAGIYYMHQFVGHVFVGYVLPKTFPALLVTPFLFIMCLVFVVGMKRVKCFASVVL